MDEVELTAWELKDAGDVRGSSFSVPSALLAEGFALQDVHISTLLPGHTRGNHYHKARQEILLIIFSDQWSLFWESTHEGPVETSTYSGHGSVIIRVPVGISHAVRNDGQQPLQIVGLTDGPFDPDAPDSFTRRVTPL